MSLACCCRAELMSTCGPETSSASITSHGARDDPAVDSGMDLEPGA